jgi:hypothetical protein
LLVEVVEMVDMVVVVVREVSLKHPMLKLAKARSQ